MCGWPRGGRARRTVAGEAVAVGAGGGSGADGCSGGRCDEGRLSSGRCGSWEEGEVGCASDCPTRCRGPDSIRMFCCMVGGCNCCCCCCCGCRCCVWSCCVCSCRDRDGGSQAFPCGGRGDRGTVVDERTPKHACEHRSALLHAVNAPEPASVGGWEAPASSASPIVPQDSVGVFAQAAVPVVALASEVVVFARLTAPKIASHRRRPRAAPPSSNRPGCAPTCPCTRD